MKDILPEPVLESLRKHYYAAVTAAEVGYEYNSADEDSVTGALGQALLAVGTQRIFMADAIWGWRTYHYRVGAHSEKRIGADGIFQLDVFDREERLLRRKGLLFQAKKNWRGADKRLLEQAQHLAHYSSSAIVIDYRGSGFKAIPVANVLKAEGNRRAVYLGGESRLAHILGDDFVRCRQGDIGMGWNPETETLEIDGREIPPPTLEHIIGTTVQRLR